MKTLSEVINPVLEVQILDSVSPQLTGNISKVDLYAANLENKAKIFPKKWYDRCVCVCALSCVWLFATPWTVAHQAPLSIEFSRQEYWSRLPLPTPGDLLDPGVEPQKFLG